MNLTQLIIEDKKLFFTILSYMSILIIFINSNLTLSSIIGITASIVYFLINATFIGNALFQSENSVVKFLLGNLIFIVILSLIGLTVLILHNIDNLRTTIVLSAATFLASILNRRMQSKVNPNKRENSTHIYPLECSYLIAIGLSLYLLYLSRADEVYTVWQVIHPAFLPTFITATFLLLIIIFSTAKVEHKLLFTILHSILSHSLMVIVFPAGKVGVQQMILGRTRLVFDNLVFHGLGWAQEGFLLKIYSSLKGHNLQAVLSSILARMLGIDVYWTHLLFIPILWGIFVPLIAFLISKTLGLNENISVLSGVLISLFPTSIIWGFSSIPHGLGYIFFFCFTYFLLEYIKSDKKKELFLALTFLIISFFSHYLAGTIAFSFFILARGVKTYEKDKRRYPLTAKLTILISFILSTSILPFALVYRRFLYPPADTYFSPEKFTELDLGGKVLTILMGSYFNFICREAYIKTLLFGISPLVGLAGMLFFLRARFKTRDWNIHLCTFFLFTAFFMTVIDDRIVKLFMMNVPFIEVDRLWVFRDFILTPFLAFLTAGIISLSRKIPLKHMLKILPPSISSCLGKTMNFWSIFSYATVLILLSGWITASIYYAYPHYGPLQTTSYELDAVKYIDQNTKEKYIVIADQWIILAGQMIVGINNPDAFFFSHVDPRGISLFIQMKTNSSSEIMIEAMKHNNSTIVYFIVVKPRLGLEKYNQIIQEAQQNGLQTYKIFYHKGEEKLRIFYYQSQLNSQSSKP
jgi:hypothetical protein